MKDADWLQTLVAKNLVAQFADGSVVVIFPHEAQSAYTALLNQAVQTVTALKKVGYTVYRSQLLSEQDVETLADKAGLTTYG